MNKAGTEKILGFVVLLVVASAALCLVGSTKVDYFFAGVVMGSAIQIALAARQ